MKEITRLLNKDKAQFITTVDQVNDSQDILSELQSELWGTSGWAWVLLTLTEGSCFHLQDSEFWVNRPQIYINYVLEYFNRRKLFTKIQSFGLND